MFISSCGTINLEEEELMPRESTLSIGGRSKKTKIGQHKGRIDLYIYKKPEEILKKRKLEKCRQSSIKDSNKDLRVETIQYIAQFFYQNGISFNVARSESFKLMVEAIGQYGKNLKPPNYHELRVSCLNKELVYTKKLMEYHRKQWSRYGVTIMSDGWTNKRQRSIINFLVNSPAGTMFVKSINASAFVKTREKLFELLDSIVEEIGEEHVVQLITDNGSNYVVAGKLLEEKRKHIFWTPCAAHCIDLILEDIGKISKVKKTIQKAISLVGFIHNHSSTLNLMRRFTNKTELVRYGVTRFATNFLSLQNVYKQKVNLRKTFTSNEWTSSKLARDAKGVNAVSTVIAASFWNNVLYTLRVMGPLVIVLWLVDSESKLAMPYIYEAMTKAKDFIKRLQNDDESKYKEIFEIIDNKRECQLYRSLHAAAHYLNLAVFYSTPNMDLDLRLTGGLMDCIKKMELDVNLQLQIYEVLIYNRARGRFGDDLPIKSRDSKSPDEIDPIVLNEIDFDNEWLVGESGEVEDVHNDSVFENDNLTWGDVKRASGAREIRTYTRGQAKRNATAALTSQVPTLTFRTLITTSNIDAVYATRISEEAHTLLDLEKSEEEEEEFEPGGTSQKNKDDDDLVAEQEELEAEESDEDY
ncbi:hypothetical protein SLEP1_g42637 [Rubroshorea leprosula]|uniref:DUF659 domain-containing protein n=1 Tax=Rubroshorea leprosula TaxID=152421 RepID=A0AAV5LAQ5_9ROSI|nr:hypothetical protein SLEP1_g42637 [Rubroshorea leprosula]